MSLKITLLIMDPAIIGAALLPSSVESSHPTAYLEPGPKSISNLVMAAHISVIPM